MILEQKFFETDLVEVEQVFSNSMPSRLLLSNRVISLCNILAYICIASLFGCSLAVTVLTGEISKETLLYAFIGGFGVLSLTGLNLLKIKLKPVNLVKRKYGRPFNVIIKEDVLVYKQVSLYYEDINVVVEYKNLLFIKVNRRLLVIKADEEEKKVLISKIMENKAIQVIHEEEPFDLRELR